MDNKILIQHLSSELDYRLEKDEHGETVWISGDWYLRGTCYEDTGTTEWVSRQRWATKQEVVCAAEEIEGSEVNEEDWICVVFAPNHEQRTK